MPYSPGRLLQAALDGPISSSVKGSPATTKRSLFLAAPEAMKETLLDAGLPPWQAGGLLEDYAHYRRDKASVVASGVKEATGARRGSFAVFARDYASHYS